MTQIICLPMASEQLYFLAGHTVEHPTALVDASREWAAACTEALREILTPAERHRYQLSDLAHSAALDIHFTVSGAGVGIWDGRWAALFPGDDHGTRVDAVCASLKAYLNSVGHESIHIDLETAIEAAEES